MNGTNLLSLITIVAVWIAQCILVASYAQMTGRPRRTALWLSLLLNPLIGTAIILFWKRPAIRPQSMADMEDPQRMSAERVNRISAWTAAAGFVLLALLCAASTVATRWQFLYGIAVVVGGIAMVLLELAAFVTGIIASRGGAKSGGLLFAIGMFLGFLALFAQVKLAAANMSASGYTSPQNVTTGSPG